MQRRIASTVHRSHSKGTLAFRNPSAAVVEPGRQKFVFVAREILEVTRHSRGVVRARVAYPWERKRRMDLREDIELLELLFVELDPLADGFAGVLVEIYRCGDRYVLLETAAATGTQLLRFSSKDKGLVYAAFARVLGDPPR